jgi:GTPase-associated protein 1
MRPVRAERLIYTRVEPAFSPRRSSGFQTVWKSELITAAETAAVEKAVQCFRPSPGVRRLQFFQISGGKIVMSHTEQIEAHPEIVDRTGREGAFLVHCFLLPREEMARLENNPFRLFDADLPLEGLEQLVEILGPGTGIVPPVEIWPVECRPDLSDWAAPEAVRLLSLALRADDQRRQGRTVPVTGDCGQIEQAFRLALHVTRLNNRLACSFSTWAEGCPLERGLFWAGGLSRRPSADPLEIDARGKRVTMAAPQRGMEDLYGSWIESACFQNPLEEVLSQAESVDRFLQAMEGARLDGEVPLRPEALTGFLHLHRHAVADKLRGTFEGHVRPPLAKELAYHLLAEVHCPEFPSLLEVTVPGSSQISGVARLATHWLERTTNPNESLRQELQDLAQKGSNIILLFWASTLGRKTDIKAREEALRKMTSQDFKRALTKLMHPIQPAHFVEIRHLPALLESERLDAANEDLLIELIERIVDIGGGSYLDSLIGCLHRIKDSGLQRLARKIRKQDVAGSFRREVEAAAPKQSGILRRLLS